MAQPQCPSCQTELRDDYGMVNCPGCGAIVFIDMDGNASVAAADESPAAEPAQNSASSHSESNQEFANFNQESENPVINSNDELPHHSGFDPAAAPTADPMAGFFEPEIAGANPAGGTDSHAPLDPNDPLGVTAFANSDLSRAADGPYVIKMEISGLDSKDLREEVRQVLKDPRFAWNARQLMDGIQQGVLIIDQINPVKASILVNRIKHLAVKIRWEQSAITELEISSENNSDSESV